MAILGIILIVLMYAATFIAAVFVKKYTVRLFLASMIMTMVVPLLYAYQMTMKIFLHLNDPDPELPSDNQKGFAEAADINQAHSSQSK